MFGLGYLEIAILVLLLCLVFGADKTGHLIGRFFQTKRRVEDATASVKRSFNPLGLFGRNHDREK